MDGEEQNGRLWTKISSLFSQKEENIEQAIIEAQEDGELKEIEGTMLLSVLEFDSMHVSEIMTPRTDVICLPIGSTINEVAKAIIETGHSRLPIFEETRDNIVGLAYAKDLLPYLIHDAQNDQKNKHEEKIESIMRKATFVPETKVCSELLQEFRTRKNHLAIVVDEYGGTAGLVTIEDLIEVIVGEIEDEYDAPKDEEISAIDENSYRLHGRVYLEDLQEIGIEIESEEVDTIGGYICLLAGRVPEISEVFELNGWNLLVEDADAKQVKKIMATKKEQE